MSINSKKNVTSISANRETSHSSSVKHFTLQKNLWWILSIFGACIGELSTSDRGFLIGWITGWSVAQMIGFIDAEDRKGWSVLLIAYLT
jgi:hypothetical protein